ncbi:MAG: LacI family DNA-binding transcriptional regulator [Chloroflexia bacterium]|nr:LacI family DNA-binding transcriptional regulator [Chloroflexia bacterium]
MVTMKDIARHAGVSPITVSRVVNSSGYVGRDTREKVESAIRELNYIPNLVASSLRSSQSDLIALVLPDITNSFWTSIARGAEDEAWEHGYGVFICNTDNNVAKEASYIERLLRRRVEGLLLVPTPDIESELQLRRMRSHGLKFVVVHRRLVDFPAEVVRSDGESAARALTNALVKAGHRRIAFIGLPATDTSSADRLHGYRSGLRAAGLEFDPQLVRQGDADHGSGGYQMVRDVFQGEARPDAVLLANSRLALGGLRAIEETGRCIPGDIGVAAFHDISAMDHYAPRLIRAVQPGYRMGQLATRRLLHMPVEPNGAYKEVILQPEIHLPAITGG